MFQRRTLRKMYPAERRLAERCNDLERALNSLKRLLPNIHEAEFSAKALENMGKTANPDALAIGIDTWPGQGQLVNGV